MRVVLTQPMLFPWVGMLEQIRLADVCIIYDDVQFSKGGFTNRVQLKTERGLKWMTVPVVNPSLEDEIRVVEADNRREWRQSHLSLLGQALHGAPFVADALALVRRVYERPTNNLCEIATASMESLCDYFDIGPSRPWARSSSLGIGGKSSQRVVDIVTRFAGDVYITGHGARNYLDHELLERRGVRVEYQDYQKRPYAQLHGAFIPYVSALDLIANCGKEGRNLICSGTVYWREFLAS